MSFNPPNNSSLNNKTTLIITLHKSKLLQTSSTPTSYSLSLSLSNSSQFTTEKISSPLYSFNQHNNTFYFKTNIQSLFQSLLSIQAVTTSFFFSLFTTPITSLFLCNSFYLSSFSFCSFSILYFKYKHNNPQTIFSSYF